MQIVYVGYQGGPFTTASTHREGDRSEVIRTHGDQPVLYENAKLYVAPAGLKRLQDWARDRAVVPALEVHRDRREKWRGA